MRLSELPVGSNFKLDPNSDIILQKVSCYHTNNCKCPNGDVHTIDINTEVSQVKDVPTIPPVSIVKLGSREFLCLNLRTMIPIDDIVYIRSDSGNIFIFQIGKETDPTILPEGLADKFQQFVASLINQEV